MIKKLLIVGVVLVVGGWLLAKTDLPSYAKTGWKQLWASTKKQVPLSFEIKRAEDMLATLDKTDDRLISTIAGEKVAVNRLEREIADMEKTVAEKREEIQARNDELKSFGSSFVTGTSPRDQLTSDLSRSFTRFKMMENTLKAKKDQLAHHKQRLEAAKEQRDSLKAERENLQARIKKLKSDAEILKAAECRSKKGLDDSQVAELARLKNLVDGLEQRIETNLVEAQMRQEAKPPVAANPAIAAPVLTKEIDNYLNKGEKAGSSVAVEK